VISTYPTKNYNVDEYFVKTFSNPCTKHVKLYYYSDEINRKQYLDDAMTFDRTIIIVIVQRDNGFVKNISTES